MAARAAAPGLANPLEARIADQEGETVRDIFYLFLNTFTLASPMGDDGNAGSSSAPGTPLYLDRIRLMQEREMTTMYVDFTHLTAFDTDTADAIAAQFYRFEPFLCGAVQTLMQDFAPDLAFADGRPRPFYVSLYNTRASKSIRALRSVEIGSLVTITGTVTRTTSTRPEIVTGAFKCHDCGTVTTGVPQQFRYAPPAMCIKPDCTNRSAFTLQVTDSVFVDWQQVTLQEHTHDIPPGSMPRSLAVIVRQDQVERVKPGDSCIVAGCLIVVPSVTAPGSQAPVLTDGGPGAGAGAGGAGAGRATEGASIAGLRGMGQRMLSYRLAFLATNIQPVKKNTSASTFEAASGIETLAEEFTAEERALIVSLSNDPRRVEKLTAAIAPSIFGHLHIKLGILLMLLGGVHKVTADRQNLRGDINVLVVGDPSAAKSQFLKFVSGFLPRSVYTSGKAASAAGLTAAVTRDPDSGEFTIEAGALMLADNGVCCIDEFDKMDPRDQSAIHEAMEQQTISIAKAGIQATLNARTSVLAAANPIGGRYDRSKTLRQNVDISPPIMSRFDLFFVVLDECNTAADRSIASHIVSLHRDKVTLARNPHADQSLLRNRSAQPDLSPRDLRTFVRFAHTLVPKLTDEAIEALADGYEQFRMGDALSSNKGGFRVTARQLESMIRLSEAHARAQMREEVLASDVQRAIRLIQDSVVRVEHRDVVIDEEGREEADDDDDDDGGGGNGGGAGSFSAPPPPPPPPSSGRPKRAREASTATATVSNDGDNDDDEEEEEEERPDASKKPRRPTTASAAAAAAGVAAAAEVGALDSTLQRPPPSAAAAAAAAAAGGGAAPVVRTRTRKAKKAVHISHELYYRLSQMILAHVTLCANNGEPSTQPETQKYVIDTIAAIDGVTGPELVDLSQKVGLVIKHMLKTDHKLALADGKLLPNARMG